MNTIVLAGGCFWGVEEFFSRVDGVIETEVCYVNGKTKNPTYEDVCSGNTGFAEGCKVIYDKNILSTENLLTKFFEIINPTSLNKQGNDVGNQYRTGIYYIDLADLDSIKSVILKEQSKYSKKIVTEVKPLENYYPAEEYHQQYLKKNPGGYCHINLN